MKKTLALGLLAALLIPTMAWADDDDDDDRRDKWREQREEWREEQEERAEEARERYEKQRKDYFKHQEKAREQERKQWSRHGYDGRPREPAYYGNGYRYAPSPQPYPQYAPRPYLPYGYSPPPYRRNYPEYPRGSYDGRQPELKGGGQIGPFRFEVWK